MITIKDVKQDLIEYLLAIDKTKLSMMDLGAYCGIVKALDEMYKPDFSESLQEMIKAMPKFSDASYRQIETKEDVSNG